MSKSSYSEKLRDPRWQKRRLEVMERDGWKCKLCGDAKSNLQVDHRWYTAGLEPWEYGDDALRTLCETCHGERTSVQRKFKQISQLLDCEAAECALGFASAWALMTGEVDSVQAPDVIDNLPFANGMSRFSKVSPLHVKEILDECGEVTRDRFMGLPRVDAVGKPGVIGEIDAARNAIDAGGDFDADASRRIERLDAIKQELTEMGIG